MCTDRRLEGLEALGDALFEVQECMAVIKDEIERVIR
jgi:hypothetical protein